MPGMGALFRRTYHTSSQIVSQTAICVLEGVSPAELKG